MKGMLLCAEANVVDEEAQENEEKEDEVEREKWQGVRRAIFA